MTTVLNVQKMVSILPRCASATCGRETAGSALESMRAVRRNPALKLFLQICGSQNAPGRRMTASSRTDHRYRAGQGWRHGCDLPGSHRCLHQQVTETNPYPSGGCQTGSRFFICPILPPRSERILRQNRFPDENLLQRLPMLYHYRIIPVKRPPPG